MTPAFIQFLPPIAGIAYHTSIKSPLIERIAHDIGFQSKRAVKLFNKVSRFRTRAGVEKRGSLTMSSPYMRSSVILAR